MMLHYADLIKLESTKDNDCFCPMCGRNLYITYIPDEKRFYAICKKCSVVRYYKRLTRDTDDY